MKVQIITTTILNGQKSQLKENVKNDDLRLEMLKNISNCYSSWSILDFDFNYKCGHTKHGYKVVETVRQHRETKETVIVNFIYT